MFRCMGCMEEFDDGLNTCPHCGYKRGTPPRDAYDLPPETILNGRYIVGRKLAKQESQKAGEKYTYLGFDCANNQKIVLREFFPSDAIIRNTPLPPFEKDDAEKKNCLLAYGERLVHFPDHSNAANVYDCFEENGLVYYIHNYINGETLDGIIMKNGPMPYPQARDTILPILQALAALHKAGIVHHHIAPDKIILTESSAILLPGRISDCYYYRNTDIIVFWPPYEAPDEHRSVPGDIRSDIYSICAVLYYMLTGQEPPEAIDRIETDPLQPPSALGIELPRSIENAILNGMNLHPENRVQTAEELIEALRGQIPVRRIYETKSTTRKNRFLHHFFPNRRI